MGNCTAICAGNDTFKDNKEFKSATSKLEIPKELVQLEIANANTIGDLKMEYFQRESYRSEASTVSHSIIDHND